MMETDTKKRKFYKVIQITRNVYSFIYNKAAEFINDEHDENDKGKWPRTVDFVGTLGFQLPSKVWVEFFALLTLTT